MHASPKLHAPKPSVLVALVHELLKAQTFETYADLVDAAKARAARLRLRYDSDAIKRAIVHVERVSGVPLVRPARVTLPTPTPTPDYSRIDAARILAAIAKQLGVKVGPR